MIEYARLITKSSEGVPTIPPSASHDNGDWSSNDIYEHELYLDSVTGYFYTRKGDEIVRITTTSLDFVPYRGATADLDLGAFDLYANKVWLYDEPNADYGSIHLTDGVFHVEDVSGHSMITFEDGYFTFANGPTTRALLNVTGLTANRDYVLPNVSGTLALTSDIPSLAGYVPTSRILTINGTPFDLSADRSWTISTATPTLDQVTTAGASTANRITIGGATTNGSVTATSLIARGNYFNNTLVASANNDVLVGLDIQPTFTNGAFTGVTNLGLRMQNGVAVFGATNYAGMNYGEVPKLYVGGSTFLNGTIQFPTSLRVMATGGGIQFAQQSAPSTNSILFFGNDSTGVYYGNYGTLPLKFMTSGANQMTIFGTGNVGINTSTDAGFRADINGTMRAQTSLTVSGTNPVAQLAGTFSYSSYVIGQINGSISGQAIASLYVPSAYYTGSGSSIYSYSIYASNSYFDKINIGAPSNTSTYANVNVVYDLSNPTLRLIGYNALTGGSGVGSGTLLFSDRTAGTQLGIAATYGGGGSRLTIFNQYNDGATSRIKINMAGTDTACFFADGSFQIGNGETTIASAILSASSTTRGFLPPRMTTTQKNAIASPAEGLIVYDTTLRLPQFYNGTLWVSL